MDSLETREEESEEVVDASVGSIVWVRRRNGSWWPGKVLGPEELSSSLLTSPRSGTPVKLLGREDASVDWYNLEKSKRVKAFRCGEFDDCIERAEAIQGIPPKKREKYARREDAILHALELERQLLESKYGKLRFSVDDRDKRLSNAVTSSKYLEIDGENLPSPVPNQISEECGSTPAGKSVTDNFNGDDINRDGNQLSADDSSACVLPHMRELQDFGLLTAPVINDELSGIAARAKRSRYAYLVNDSGSNLKGNEIESSKMEVSVSKFKDSDCIYPVDMDEQLLSESTENTETDCSETDYLESDRDDDITVFSEGSASIELQPKYLTRIEAHEEHGSFSSYDHDGLLYAHSLPATFSNSHVSTNMEDSKWQLKGRRKTCNLKKRSLDGIGAEASRGVIMSPRNYNENTWSFKPKLRRSFRTHLQDPCHTIVDAEGDLTCNSPLIVKGYSDYMQERIDPLYVDTHHLGGRIILVDVELKVQASDYRRDVPLISLMSKLNGHAIVGHPIQTEVLECGSSANLLAGNEYCFNQSLEDTMPVLPRVWKTGRRTSNFRVPRPNMSSALDSDNRHKSLLSNQDRKRVFRAEQVSFNQKKNATGNRFFQHPVDEKSLRSSPMNTTVSSNLKMRTLLSIESEQEHDNNLLSGVEDPDDGLMKTEYLPTTITCIPVKLVFSRLQEELDGRHQRLHCDKKYCIDMSLM